MYYAFDCYADLNVRKVRNGIVGARVRDAEGIVADRRNPEKPGSATRQNAPTFLFSNILRKVEKNVKRRYTFLKFSI